MATSIFRRDFLMRKLVNPATVSVDSTGRATTSTADHLGRALTTEVWAGTHAVVVGERVQITATGIVYVVTANGTTAAGEPTAPGVGNTVVSGTATLMQETTG